MSYFLQPQKKGVTIWEPEGRKEQERTSDDLAFFSKERAKHPLAEQGEG